jgi:hypothetical protein
MPIKFLLSWADISFWRTLLRGVFSKSRIRVLISINFLTFLCYPSLEAPAYLIPSYLVMEKASDGNVPRRLSTAKNY